MEQPSTTCTHILMALFISLRISAWNVGNGFCLHGLTPLCAVAAILVTARNRWCVFFAEPFFEFVISRVGIDVLGLRGLSDERLEFDGRGDTGFAAVPLIEDFRR